MLAEHMTWEDYREEVNRSVIILPVGALEQHGPHLPLNVDTVIPTRLAMMVDEKIESIVLPPITYGYKPLPGGGGERYPGTTSLDGSTLVGLILDVLRATYRNGGRKFLILNGHYENVAFATEAAELLLREGDDARIILLSWWDQVSDDLLDELFADAGGFPGWDTEHAGLSETALMQYFAPELVRENKIIDDERERKPAYLIFPPPDDIITESGIFYKATYASREKGEKLARHAADTIVEMVRREFGC